MTPQDIAYISEIIKKRSGITLGPDKGYLIESRLQPIYRGLGLATLTDFVQHLKTKQTETMLVEVTEAMTTNESYFFRDAKPFDQLRNVVLPRLREKSTTKQLRVWSAACSTGQEPYSIAMCLQEEAAKMPGWSYKILATDLAQKVVDKAKKAVYTQFEVQRGLPIQFLIKYFAQQADNHWQVKPEITSMVQFQTANLLQDFSYLGRFDIIFCRNVLIYFDDATKSDVMNRLSKCLNPHGMLYLGSAETTLGLTDRFKPLETERGIYTLAA